VRSSHRKLPGLRGVRYAATAGNSLLFLGERAPVTISLLFGLAEDIGVLPSSRANRVGHLYRRQRCQSYVRCLAFGLSSFRREFAPKFPKVVELCSASLPNAYVWFSGRELVVRAHAGEPISWPAHRPRVSVDTFTLPDVPIWKAVLHIVVKVSQHFTGTNASVRKMADVPPCPDLEMQVWGFARSVARGAG
jgi:hypothetical protein